MSGELSDKDPFAEDEGPEVKNLITEGMVKKATYLIHKLAEQRKQDFKEIQKKCKALFAYTNLAKVTLEDGHKIIDKLIELTGGEEAQPAAPQLPTKPDDGSRKKEIKNESKHEEKDEGSIVTATMREAVRDAVDITIREVVEKDVPVQGLGGFVLEIAKVIFDAKMQQEEAV